MLPFEHIIIKFYYFGNVVMWLWIENDPIKKIHKGIKPSDGSVCVWITLWITMNEYKMKIERWKEKMVVPVDKTCVKVIDTFEWRKYLIVVTYFLCHNVT